MRRWGTAVVVGAIVLLALLAAADAFRGSGKEQVEAPPTTSTIHPRGRPTLTGTLERHEIGGRLIYSDFLCRLRVVLLPSLEREPVRAENGAQETGCSFSLAAGHFLRGNVAMTRGGGTIARCRGDRVTIRNVVSGSVLDRARGCPVAWRDFQEGGSQLTRFDRGAIVADHTTLVSHARLVAAARKHPSLVGLDRSIPLHVSVAEFAWPDEHRLAAILDISAREIRPERMLILLDGGHLTGISTDFGGLMQHLVTSANGTYVATEPGTILRTRDGSSRDLPRTLGIVHVFAFSPDKRWLAVGTRASVFLVSVTDIEGNQPSPRIYRLPILATDLVWEGGGVTPVEPTAG
jgi:hypothetical protein